VSCRVASRPGLRGKGDRPVAQQDCVLARGQIMTGRSLNRTVSWLVAHHERSVAQQDCARAQAVLNPLRDPDDKIANQAFHQAMLGSARRSGII
jgi:hypothetical protein